MANVGSQSPTPAEIYDQRFVPALFGAWGPRICDLAGVAPGHAVLDVACGTGALTLAAAESAGSGGRVVGLDVNEEMLAVARRKSEAIEWTCAPAEALPFEDASFQRAVSQFGFMFFAQQAGALAEMKRVVEPGGRLVVAVCDGLDHSPGYAVLTELLHRLFGAEVAEAFRAPFSAGDRDHLQRVAAEAELSADIRRLDGTVAFDSVGALVATERACAWTLGGLLDDDQFERLASAAPESLAPFTDADGTVRFEMPALCIVADVPDGAPGH